MNRTVTTAVIAVSQLAGLVEDPALDARIAGVEVVEHGREGVALGAHLGLTARVGAQDGGDPDLDGHQGVLSSSVCSGAIVTSSSVTTPSMIL